MAENATAQLSGTGVAIPDIGIDPSAIISALLLLAIAYIAVRIVVFLLGRLSERAYEHRITVKMAIPIAKLAIYGFAVYHILSSVVQLSTNQLIAFSGLAGAAIGFGLKDLVAEVVGGVVIVLDKPFQVGDKVRIDDHYGEVTDIGLRATRLVTPDDNLVTVSNQRVLSQTLANANAGSLEMQVVIDLFIDSSSDAPKAMRILREAAVTSKYVYISNKRPVTILMRDHPFYSMVRARVYVNDIRYEFKFETDVTKRAWEAFKSEGIEPPKAGVVDLGGGPAAGGG